MAHPEVPHLPQAGDHHVPDAGGATPSKPPDVNREVARAAALFGVSLLLCLAVYVALTVPGRWFPGVAPKAWSARDLVLARGGGEIAGGEFVVTGLDASGLALITLTTSFRSTEYPTIAWNASGVFEPTDVRLLWNTDYAPARINSTPLTIAGGRLLPVSLARDPNWTGRITGLALAIRGALPQPMRVGGVVAKPMGAVDIATDRVDEWLAFEAWSGSSINTVTGGAEVQELSLPLLLVAGLFVAAALWYVRARRGVGITALPWVLGSLFVCAWFALDARWTLNLVRQVGATATTYAGKDWHQRHLASEDGQLFSFIEKVRAKLPATPVRVIVVADADYFRGRGAYHLYPHNVYFDPRRNTMPSPSALKPGDYLVVYQRRGVQYDPGQKRLRWDGGEPVAAEMLEVGQGAALFRIL